MTPSIGPTAPLSPLPEAVVWAPAVEDEVLLAGSGVNVVGADWEAVVDKVGRTVVDIAVDWVVEVEEGVFEGLVFDEGEVEVMEELELELELELEPEVEPVGVLSDESVVLDTGPDGDAADAKVAVDLAPGALELGCKGGFDLDTVVVELGFWPPPTTGAGGAVDESAFGHIVGTPLPMKNIPINVFGYAFVPLHALFMRSVTSSNCVMQLGEHAAPLLKSSAVQPERGEL